MQKNGIHVYTNCHRGNRNHVYVDCQRGERNQKQSNSVSVYTSCHKEKETKGAISISTPTVTEAEQPKPVAVAPVQKKKSKSKSVRIVTDEDVAGPSHPAEETEPEIITRSLSLGELRDLRREFTHQTNESILTWLLCVWDAAANDTILDGSEARQLGSLSRDVVIDQGIGRTRETLSLWRRLLTSVRDRHLCKEDLQVHQGKWSTMEQGTRCLRELAVLEIIFSEDERFPKIPDDVQCTSQMWLRFARLGPEMYFHYLAMLQWREGEDKVGILVNKLRIYEDTVTAPFHTHASSMETRLAEQVRSLIEEGHQKLKKELKEEIYHISPEPTRVSAIRSRDPPARERGYAPQDDSSAVGLLRVEEQQVPIATATIHRRQYRTDRDSVIPIHEMIRKLESQGVVSKARSPFNSPVWPVRKSSGEWSLTVDYRALNAVTRPLSAAVPAMLELQYDLESKAENPTICHGLIQTALEKGEAPEHLQYIDDIIVWGNTAGKFFKKGEKIIQILLKAGLPLSEVRLRDRPKKSSFLGVKWQDGHCQIPTEVINKITTMSSPTNKKETQAFLCAIGFWRMYIPEYSQIIKQEIAHAIALGPVRTGPDVKNLLYSAAGNNGLSWSLWQKVPGESRGRPLGFWSRSYRGSEANYTPTEKEILATYEGVQAASEVSGTETQLLLAPRLLVLGWMFKGKVPSTHHATDTTWSKWIFDLITQHARIGNRNCPGILEIKTNWPEVLLWGWLNHWKKAGWQHRGKPTWAAEIWQDIATQVEKLTVKVRHMDAHVSKSRDNEEHHNNEQVDKAAKVKVAQVDVDWQHKEEVFRARSAHDASGHQGRDATYRWARDRAVDLTMDNIS
ncbi:hypothetical protein DUI87_05113 [Hirundo rustica rustica]|uniref:Reverse transcriptase/retrotransposon-derived protein RNase H-like domain-containing protein n=1 Tax=Hirundo rustica rustica TaxID=333673 RepID=A0A3M0KY55_HIRRU|nr:hypothetical protein DUI87_05113 [Hirundo rustica rustica]